MSSNGLAKWFKNALLSLGLPPQPRAEVGHPAEPESRPGDSGRTSALVAFSVPKVGDTAQGNQDVLLLGHHRSWAAIADGASGSSYPDLWARILVSALGLSIKSRGRLPSDAEVDACLPALRKRWHNKVDWEILEQRGPLFFSKARNGAGTTLLAVSFSNTEWQALAVGDSNLFILTADATLHSVGPLHAPDEFGARPELLMSVSRSPTSAKPMWRCADQWRPGERLLMCTDKLALYLMERAVAGHSIAHELTEIPDAAAFAAWVSRARVDGLQDDDTTVVLVCPRVPVASMRAAEQAHAV